MAASTYLRDLLVPGLDWVEFSSDAASLVSYTGEAAFPPTIAAWPP